MNQRKTMKQLDNSWAVFERVPGENRMAFSYWTRKPKQLKAPKQTQLIHKGRKP